MGKILFVLLGWLFLSHHAFAQSIKRFEVEGQYGMIIPHSPAVRDISKPNPWGINLSYSSLGLSKEHWRACNCFYYTGVSLAYHNFMDPEVLGTASSAALFFEPILYSNERIELTLRSGMGLSYVSEYFDEETNPENVFFSIPLNFMLFINPRVNYLVNDYLQLNLSFTFNHISNGGQSLPNYGMNFPMVGLGASYLVDHQPKPSYTAPSVSHKMQYYAEVFGTFNLRVAGANLKPSYGISGGAYYNIGANNALGGGVEANFDRSLGVDEEEEVEGFITAPYISHHFLIGRFDFSQRIAYYLFKPEGYVPFNFFQRYTLTMQVTPRFKAGVSLKTHRAIADNVDLRVGFLF
ncbi:acyloxyacyl hydrolase [Cytophagaceae bacterium ABcell3]|nr:acyloxyacyl hydrolase [Cytophagaceae bacterium ABcell3]